MTWPKIRLSSRPWAIELYSDDGSIVRHNTLVYGSCSYNLKCGMIDLNRKSADDAGKNTQVYDNVATQVLTNAGSTTSKRDHNMVRQSAGSGDFLGTPVFVGTRVPVQTLLDYLAAGDPLDEFLEDFPSVSHDQAIAALRLAGQLLVNHANPA